MLPDTTILRQIGDFENSQSTVIRQYQWILIGNLVFSIILLFKKYLEDRAIQKFGKIAKKIPLSSTEIVLEEIFSH